MKIAANGINLKYRVDGPRDAPWLTLSNSLATNLSLWDAQVAELASTYRVLRYDTRGHGGSDAPDGPYTLAMLRDDVLGLLDALGIETTHFVGISLGGMTALELALALPDRVDRIAVCDSRADAPPAFANSWDERLAIAAEKGMEGLVEATLARWFSEGFLAQDPPALTAVGDMIRGTSLAGYIGCIHALQKTRSAASPRRCHGAHAFRVGGRRYGDAATSHAGDARGGAGLPVRPHRPGGPPVERRESRRLHGRVGAVPQGGLGRAPASALTQTDAMVHGGARISTHFGGRNYDGGCGAHAKNIGPH